MDSPEKLSDPLLADAICDRIVHDAYTVVISGNESGMSNWEQKIVEFRLYRDSTISNKSLASVSFRGYRVSA